MRRQIQTAFLTCMVLLPLAVWAQSPPPAPVLVDEAMLDTFSATIWVSGTVISRNDAHIGAETDGRITWVAEVGERIAAGKPIAMIDAADLELELQDNQAMLESLRARKRFLKNNLERWKQLALNNNAAINSKHAWPISARVRSLKSPSRTCKTSVTVISATISVCP